MGEIQLSNISRTFVTEWTPYLNPLFLEISIKVIYILYKPSCPNF